MSIKINYLKIIFFIITTFLNVFSKKIKNINIKYIKIEMDG
jgi:hypothetical protein